MAAATKNDFLFTNDLLTINKIDDSLYSFTFNDKDEKSDLLIQSLYKQFKSLMKKEDDRYIVKCDSIETLPQLISRKRGVLSYEQTLLCILQIGEQCIFLNEKGVVYPFIDINSIVVVNDNLFMLFDSELIEYSREIDGNKIYIIPPFDKTFLFSDELLSVKSLPARIHFNNWVFSIGLLGIYIISGKTDISNKTDANYREIIENIQDTKLYFMLMRCVEKKFNKRKLLYI
jgi:hypothetical protein